MRLPSAKQTTPTMLRQDRQPLGAPSGNNPRAGSQQRSRNDGIDAAPTLKRRGRLVKVISGEHLISSLARQNHLHVLAGQLGDVVERDGRQIRKRLIRSRDQLG